jgi:hypothetical protein
LPTEKVTRVSTPAVSSRDTEEVPSEKLFMLFHTAPPVVGVLVPLAPKSR